VLQVLQVVSIVTWCRPSRISHNLIVAVRLLCSQVERVALTNDYSFWSSDKHLIQ